MLTHPYRPALCTQVDAKDRALRSGYCMALVASLTALESLSVSGCCVPLELAALGRLEKLPWLKTNAFPDDCRDAVTGLSLLTRLQVLKLDIQGVGNVNDLAHLVALRSLELRGDFSDASFLSALMHLEHLLNDFATSLDELPSLGHLSRLTSVSLEHTATPRLDVFGTSLKQLTVNGGEYDVEWCFDPPSVAMPGVMSLDLQFVCSSEDGSLPLVDWVPSLETLHLVTLRRAPAIAPCAYAAHRCAVGRLPRHKWSAARLKRSGSARAFLHLGPR